MPKTAKTTQGMGLKIKMARNTIKHIRKMVFTVFRLSIFPKL